MNNIFENAYFGKPYKTRDGKKAIYLRGNFKHHLYLETGGIIDCNQDGTYEGVLGRMEPLDIVSEWQEEIDEEKLDKLAKEYEENYPLDDSAYSYYCYDGFKAGYRKAKEKL